MPASRSHKVLVVPPRNAISRVCILLYMSSCIAGQRYLNSLTLKLGLNYTCRVHWSFNFSIVSIITIVTVLLLLLLIFVSLNVFLS